MHDYVTFGRMVGIKRCKVLGNNEKKHGTLAWIEPDALRAQHV